MTTEAKPQRERRDFSAYLRRIADILALRDWQAEITGESTGSDEDLALVSRTRGRKCARVDLGDCFLAETESEQRHTIVHELLHLHLTPTDFFLEGKLSKSDYEAYQMLREYAIDGIADGVSHGFPLPSEVIGPAPIADDSQTPWNSHVSPRVGRESERTSESEANMAKAPAKPPKAVPAKPAMPPKAGGKMSGGKGGMKGGGKGKGC